MVRFFVQIFGTFFFKNSIWYVFFLKLNGSVLCCFVFSYQFRTKFVPSFVPVLYQFCTNFVPVLYQLYFINLL